MHAKPRRKKIKPEESHISTDTQDLSNGEKDTIKGVCEKNMEQNAIIKEADGTVDGVKVSLCSQ